MLQQRRLRIFLQMIISQPRVALPEAIEPHTENLRLYSGNPKKDSNAIAYMLQAVSFEELQRARKDKSKRDRPQCYAITNDGIKSVLHLWPTPDKTYHATLRYCPAMKEI